MGLGRGIFGATNEIAWTDCVFTRGCLHRCDAAVGNRTQADRAHRRRPVGAVGWRPSAVHSGCSPCSPSSPALQRSRRSRPARRTTCTSPAQGLSGCSSRSCLQRWSRWFRHVWVQSVVAAIRRPSVAHEHAGVVGSEDGGGIVEPAVGADRVDRRVRGDERPEPMADGADAPAGLVRRDYGRVADLLAQFRVGRRGGAGRPVQHVGEAARRDLQAERGPQQVRDLRQRHPHLRVQLDHQRDDPATELRARRAQRVRGLQDVAALHPSLTLRAAADLDVEAAHDRAHHGQFFLILRRHAGHCDRATAIRTRHRNWRRVRLVDPRRARTAAVAAILRAGLPPRTPATTLRPVLGERRGLAATRPACLVELLFSGARSVASGGHSPVAGGRSCVAVSCVALAPRHLSLKPFDVGVQFRNPIRGRFPVGDRHAIVMLRFENCTSQNFDALARSPLNRHGSSPPPRSHEMAPSGHHLCAVARGRCTIAAEGQWSLLEWWTFPDAKLTWSVGVERPPRLHHPPYPYRRRTDEER